jgi:radical SAM superfamily enzyme YgiQ (UPF0313 family)
VLDLAEYYGFHGKVPEDVIDPIVDDVISSHPDILGLSTMSNNICIALEICREAKRELPGLYTILGGPGVSFCARDVIQSFSQVDSVIRGEADAALPDLVEALSAGERAPSVEGLVSREGNNIIDHGWPTPVENLDDLPIPLYEICQGSSSDAGEGIKLEVGRGCPFNCTFCSTSAFFKRRFRVKSVGRVLTEISLVQSKLGNTRISFNHDLLTFRRAYIEELCKALQTHRPAVRWSCNARLDTVDAEILQMMRQAGCEKLYLGIEVGTDRMQELINKRLDLGKLSEVLRALDALDLQATFSFIVGIPGEKRADIEALWSQIFHIKSANMHRFHIQVHTLAPDPGSCIFERWEKNLVYDDYGNPGHSTIPTSWTRLREMIKNNPRVFPFDFHIAAPPISRLDSLKHVFLGNVLETFSSYSLQEAYSHLGDELPLKLVVNTKRLEIPLPGWPTVDYPRFMESIRRLVVAMLRNNGIAIKRYDAIAQWELAVREILDRRSEKPLKVIEVYFDPQILIQELVGRLIEATDVEERHRFLAVFWDENEESMKQTEIPEPLATLIQ